MLGPDQSISAASQGTQMCNQVLRTTALGQCFSAGAAFAPQGALGHVWRRFWLLQLRLGERMVSSGRRSGMLLNKAPTRHSRAPPAPRLWIIWPHGQKASESLLRTEESRPCARVTHLHQAAVPRALLLLREVRRRPVARVRGAGGQSRLRAQSGASFLGPPSAGGRWPELRGQPPVAQARRGFAPSLPCAAVPSWVWWLWTHGKPSGRGWGTSESHAADARSVRGGRSRGTSRRRGPGRARVREAGAHRPRERRSHR